MRSKVFVHALPDAARAVFAEMTDLEDRLAALVREARAAWPGLELPEERFLAHLAARVATRKMTARGLEQLRTGDLYLACACTAGDRDARRRRAGDGHDVDAAERTWSVGTRAFWRVIRKHTFRLMDWFWIVVLFEVLFMAGVLGQTAMAAVARMRVEVFSFGYGPRLVRAGRVQLALFPLGGYVRVAGLQPTENTVDNGDRRAFFNRPLPLRALVVLGWPVGASLLVLAVTAGSLLVFGKVSSSTALVTHVAPGSPAESAGLRAGDEILSIEGDTIDAPGKVAARVGASGGRPFTMDVRRGGERRALRVTASEAQPGVYRIGIQLGTRPMRTPVGLAGALVESVRATYARMNLIVVGLYEVAAGPEVVEFRGPVGIAAIATTTPGSEEAVALARLLGAYLVFCSLVPVPPLPGGQLLLVLLGWRSRRLRSAQAARDLGAIPPARHRMPLVLLAALLPVAAWAVLTFVAALELYSLPAVIGAALSLFILAGAVALARRLPRAWAWGVYLPLLHVPSAVLREMPAPSWTLPVELALLLAIPATLLLPSVRRAFGRECPACHRLAAAPVRSSRRFSCLACGSGYSPRRSGESEEVTWR